MNIKPVARVSVCGTVNVLTRKLLIQEATKCQLTLGGYTGRLLDIWAEGRSLDKVVDERQGEMWDERLPEGGI